MRLDFENKCSYYLIPSLITNGFAMTFYKHKEYVYSLFLALILLSSSTAVISETLTFSAPPRESRAIGIKTYEPIAKFLTKLVGKKVIYKHPGNWAAYTANMRKDKYEFVFDGPHLVSWRVKYLKHKPLVKIPGDFIFAYVAKKDNKKIDRLTDLVGKNVCGHAPPNQGTLRLYNQLNNPVRQPTLVTVRGWRNIYKAMMKGKCEVAIVPLKILKEMDPNKTQTKVIFSSRPAAGQAITMSGKFSDEVYKNIRDTLMSDKGQEATKSLQQRFASKALVEANSSEYTGEYNLLKYSYGFDNN